MKFLNRSRVDILIYVVILLWIIFGIFGIYRKTNLVELAGYYTSLSLFVGTYFWGEYKRTSTESKILEKGPNSIREITIYITLLLWAILGVYGILKETSMNDLTVYFAALSPFVSSFIIYKTSKGNTDLPIFNEQNQEQSTEITDKVQLITEQIGNIVNKVEDTVEQVKDNITNDK